MSDEAEDPGGAGHLVIARLNARLRPLDRADIYEDPLEHLLKERALGEVTGGGTQLSKDKEILFCDIEILLTKTDDEAIELIQKSLELFGAPNGSVLIVDAEREIPFGVNEGLGVYLNGTDLPDRVYQECDVNLVWDEFEKRLGPNGRIQSYLERPRETALYLYGPSYDTMVDCIRPFMDSYPLCEKARLERIA